MEIEHNVTDPWSLFKVRRKRRNCMITLANDQSWMKIKKVKGHLRLFTTENGDPWQQKCAISLNWLLCPRDTQRECMISLDWEWYVHVLKWLLLYPETENAYKEMTRAKVKVFSLTRSRPRKNQIFWPVHLNHTFLHLRTPGEVVRPFFSNLPAYNPISAP